MAGGEAQREVGPVRLNWRLYRLYLIPVVVTLMIAAFAFGNRAAPLRSTLVPEAFDGGQAFALLHEMAALAPDPTPGGEGDRRLLGYIEMQLRAAGEAGRGGYSLKRLTVSAPTSLGKRTLTLLLARRPGSTAAPPIVLVARRDAVGGTQASRRAQLSGSAALLELALALANSETKHPLEVVFSDGGSAGAAGIAAYLKSMFGGSADAAIVLGDLAGRTLRRPLVLPFSNAFGGAPEALQNTVSASLGRTLGIDAGAPSIASQLAHLIFPLTVGEQGLLNAAGVPAVAVDLAGERGPPTPGAHESVSRRRLESTGKAVLSAFYALDDGPQIPASANHDLTFHDRTVPGWALRLLIGALLLAPIALCCDALVRLSRRGEQAGRWISLSFSGAIPFFACAILVKLLAAVGLLSAPPSAAPAAALAFGAGSVVTIALALAALALGLRAWWLRAARPLLGSAGSSGIAALAMACVTALVVWLFNPYAALLLIPGLHIWPLVLGSERRLGTRAARLALALAPLIPLGLVLLYYALALGLGPLQLLLSGTLLLGGGQIGWGAAVLWSLALGVLVTALLAALRDRSSMRSRPQPPAVVDKRARIGVGNV